MIKSTRRNFFKQAAALVALGTLGQYAQATSLEGSVLIEILNFHCPRCNTVNDHYDRIYAAARSRNIGFRVAPLAWEGQSLWPDRVYYAVRDLYPGLPQERNPLEALIRSTLFDGIQREGLRFEEIEQIMSFFARRQIPERAIKLNPAFSLSAIAEYAASDTPVLSEMKAGRLLDLTGAEAVPVFAWVRSGEVIASVSPSSDTESAASLVNRVLQKISPKD